LTKAKKTIKFKWIIQLYGRLSHPFCFFCFLSSSTDNSHKFHWSNSSYWLLISFSQSKLKCYSWTRNAIFLAGKSRVFRAKTISFSISIKQSKKLCFPSVQPLPFKIFCSSFQLWINTQVSLCFTVLYLEDTSFTFTKSQSKNDTYVNIKITYFVNLNFTIFSS
jgi:hypothetical protein